MKPRFGDEYKVGFLTVSHLLSLLPVRRFCSINYNVCALQYRHSKFCFGAVLPKFLSCVSCAVCVFFAFLQYVLSFLVLVLLPGLQQTCQLSRVSRESHGFLHFLQSHGRGNSCSRVYSCTTVLFSHRLLPIIIAGNTFWQHKFSVK